MMYYCKLCKSPLTTSPINGNTEIGYRYFFQHLFRDSTDNEKYFNILCDTCEKYSLNLYLKNCQRNEKRKQQMDELKATNRKSKRLMFKTRF